MDAVLQITSHSQDFQSFLIKTASGDDVWLPLSVICSMPVFKQYLCVLDVPTRDRIQRAVYLQESNALQHDATLFQLNNIPEGNENERVTPVPLAAPTMDDNCSVQATERLSPTPQKETINDADFILDEADKPKRGRGRPRKHKPSANSDTNVKRKRGR